jgi:hypothetical protein
MTLEPHRPQGINPKILLLSVETVAPTGLAGDVITTHPVKFDEDPAMVDYTQVTIRDGPSGSTINVTSA